MRDRKDKPARQLVVRNLEEEIVHALRIRAARNHRSAEAEHRAILREVLSPTPKQSFKDYLLEMPGGGGDSVFDRPRDMGRKVRL